MYAQFAAGDLGDICAFDPSHFHFWRAIDKGIIGPLDDLVKADGLDLKQWFDTFINLQIYKGQMYGLPSWGWAGYDTIVMNAVHLKEAGITPPEPDRPRHVDGHLAEWARKLDKKPERYGLGLTYGEALLATLTRAFNGDLIDAEGKKSLLATDKNAQEGLRWAYKLAVEEKITPRPADTVATVAALVDGKLSMMWSGSLDVRNFKRGIKDAATAEAWQGLLPMRTGRQAPDPDPRRHLEHAEDDPAPQRGLPVPQAHHQRGRLHRLQPGGRPGRPGAARRAGGAGQAGPGPRVVHPQPEGRHAGPCPGQLARPRVHRRRRAVDRPR